MGLHSGQVIAGVLRGEKSRFQLFGDTVNTAARMESTGERSRIHISQVTADIIIASGKSNWVMKRQDVVHAKGKGAIQTYWVLGGSAKSAAGNSSNESEGALLATSDELTPSLPSPATIEKANMKQARLVEWHVDILMQYLKRIVATRSGASSSELSGLIVQEEEPSNLSFQAGKLVLDEVAEVIVLPRYEGNHSEIEPNQVILSPEVVLQLKDFICSIATLYRSNPFHSFEHASHVMLSATKLLNRIVTPEVVDLADAAQVHNYTYGINSDPLTQFSVALAALIHDVDHTGVPNVQLAKENPGMAEMYRNKSIAEQNSVDVAWNLLMDLCYKDLQSCIYANNGKELKRFRQLMVNTVMATDIFDSDMKKLRECRWTKAFSERPGENATDLKATIVIEHIIQAADVAVSSFDLGLASPLFFFLNSLSFSSIYCAAHNAALAYLSKVEQEAI
jgi:hypothetical protein